MVDRELETIQAVLRARGVEQARYSINGMKFVASETARGLGLIDMLFLSPSQDVIFLQATGTHSQAGARRR